MARQSKAILHYLNNVEAFPASAQDAVPWTVIIDHWCGGNKCQFFSGPWKYFHSFKASSKQQQE
jgi:hypothetical protein